MANGLAIYNQNKVISKDNILSELFIGDNKKLLLSKSACKFYDVSSEKDNIKYTKCVIPATTKNIYCYHCFELFDFYYEVKQHVRKCKTKKMHCNNCNRNGHISKKCWF